MQSFVFYFQITSPKLSFSYKTHTRYYTPSVLAEMYSRIVKMLQLNFQPATLLEKNKLFQHVVYNGITVSKF